MRTPFKKLDKSHPDSWSKLSTHENIDRIPPEMGIRVSSGGLWRPIGFLAVSYRDGMPRVAVAASDQTSTYTADLPIDVFPYIKTVEAPEFADLAGVVIGVQHQKGRGTKKDLLPEREQRLRLILVGNGSDETVPPVAIRNSKRGHPEHQGQPGQYLLGPEIGKSALDGLPLRLRLRLDSLVTFETF
jgi:hypothetical protein